MSQLTAQQWKEIENAVTIFHQVTLNVDGYHIGIAKELNDKKNKLYYMVWVNNKFDSADCNLKSDIGKRFYNRLHFFFPKKKDYNITVKELGKRVAKRIWGHEPQKKLYMFSPNYTSFRTIKKVLTENNQSIEIIQL